MKLVSSPIRNLSAQRLYKEVEQQAVNSCNYGQLLGKAKEVTKADPMFDKAYVLQSEIFISLNRYADALDVIEKAIRINPYNAKAYASKAYIYDLQCFNEKALEYCNKAFEVGVTEYDLAMSLFDQKLSLLTGLKKDEAIISTLNEASKVLDREDHEYLKDCYHKDVAAMKAKLVAIS